MGFQGTAQSDVETIATVVQLLSIPFLALAATVRNNAYPEFAAKVNEYVPILPTELGPWTISVMNFFAEHTGNMVRVAMFVTGVVLIALGNPIYGSMILVGLVYELIDSQGLIPHRMRFYTEKILPHITNLSYCFAGDWFTCIFGVIAITGELVRHIPNVSFIREDLNSEFPLGDFFLHMKNLIDANKSLNEEENEKISALLADGIPTYSGLGHRAAFVRLLYVTLGIYSDQTELEESEA